MADGPEIFAISLFYRRSYGAFNDKLEGKVAGQEGVIEASTSQVSEALRVLFHIQYSSATFGGIK